VFSLNTCMFVSDLKPADCAAWVQAVGAILAIVASAGLVYWQLSHSRRRENEIKNEERQIRLETVFQLCSHSRQVTEKVVAEAKRTSTIDEPYLQTALGELDAIVTALKKYEPKDFSDYEQLRPFMGALAVTNTVRSACESARSICATRAVSGQISVTLSDLAKSLITTEGELKALADKHRKR
jgi:hypothetical protein